MAFIHGEGRQLPPTLSLPWFVAAFAQFDNDVRSKRTRAGMKAALEIGRWVFLAPIGYINAPRAISKSVLHDPERAPIIRLAFEDYAAGRVHEAADSRREGDGRRLAKPPQPAALVASDRPAAAQSAVRRRYRRARYGVRDWPGDFEPIIPRQLFDRAQAVLAGRIPSPAPRLRSHPDSPLRNLVRSERRECGTESAAGCIESVA